MPFFVPSRLIEFEYLGGDDGEVDEEARAYQSDMDLAFFVTNFGYSKSDYNELTPRERAFIMKAWENKLVADTTHLRNAVANAVSNVMRKKGTRFVELWKKAPKAADVEVAKAQIALVEKLESEDKSWIDKIYAANGMKRGG